MTYYRFVDPSSSAWTQTQVQQPLSPPPPPPHAGNTEASITRRGSVMRALSAPAMLVGAGIVASTYVYLNDPSTGGSIFPKCPFKVITGWDCPGCGLTRSVYSLLHGDPIGAIGHNLLILFIGPWLVMAIARWTAQRFGYELPRLFTVKQWMVPVMVVLLTVFTVARNLPIEPFSWFNSGPITPA